MNVFSNRKISPEISCLHCGRKSREIAANLKVCADCIRTHFDLVAADIEKAHAKSRRAFNLPERIPKAEGGVRCKICGNGCIIPQDERGFCGLRENQNGRLRHLGGTSERGFVSWYYDPLPTNCVASWVCPAGSDCGYPEYSYQKGPEYGYKNLAVFYEACSFNCLFCQNWHFRETSFQGRGRTAQELAQAVDNRTACICYFGGDPTPQLPHAIAASKLALKQNTNRILRICWETNGSMSRPLLKKMLELSLKSGGCIKFDLKTFDEHLNLALCGVSNRQTLENFRWVAQFIKQRPDPPLLIASTLLVPGYIDAEEVGKIAQFIASLDPSIPYSLLAFYPQFYMTDLPVTSRRQAQECLDAAQQAGLKRVKIGNIHLLGYD